MKYISLIIIFIILNILDIGTTYYGLSLGYIEANRIVVYLVNNNMWIVSKVLLMVIVIVGLIASRYVKKLKTLYIVLFIILNFILLTAVINNLIVINC